MEKMSEKLGLTIKRTLGRNNNKKTPTSNFVSLLVACCRHLVSPSSTPCALSDTVCSWPPESLWKLVADFNES